MKYIDWKNVIALAALIYALSFAFQVYGDYKVAKGNLKLRLILDDAAPIKSETYHLLFQSFGDKESENIKKFIWDVINN